MAEDYIMGEWQPANPLSSVDQYGNETIRAPSRFGAGTGTTYPIYNYETSPATGQEFVRSITHSSQPLGDYLAGTQAVNRLSGVDTKWGSGATESGGASAASYPRASSGASPWSSAASSLPSSPRSIGGGTATGAKPATQGHSVPTYDLTRIIAAAPAFTSQAQPPVITPLNLPAYTAPSWDEGRIADLTQQYGSAASGRLSNALREIMGRIGTEENPYLKRQMLRESLRGYGQGLDASMAEAGKAARAEYGQEFASKVSEAATNHQTATTAAQARWGAENQAATEKWRADIAREQAEYEGKLKAYLASLSSMAAFLPAET